MTALTQTDWIGNTTLLLMATIPGYEYSDAQTIVSTYLTNAGGGWVPTTNGDTGGVGAPANSQSPAQAAQALIDGEFNAVTKINLNVSINVSVTDVGQYPIGTSTSSVFSALQSDIETRLQSYFSNSPVFLNSFTYSHGSDTLSVGGYLTASDRVSINTQILNSTNLVDPSAIATAYIRSLFGLNTTWIASKLYKRANYPIVVFVGKYTDTTYNTVDVSNTSGSVTTTYPGYIVYIDPVSYNVQNVLTSPLSTTTTS